MGHADTPPKQISSVSVDPAEMASFARMATRLGAHVTGVDALEKNLKTAKTHAEQVGLDIDYRHGTIEQLVQAKENSKMA